MNDKKILELVLRGYPVLFKTSGSPIREMIWHVRSAPKVGKGKYRLHYCVVGFQDWKNVLTDENGLLNSLREGNLSVVDYFDLPKQKVGKHRCRCKIMDLMAAGCRCGGI